MIRNYIKIAWKVLARNKFFTFVSLFGISLTIGILLVLATLFDQIVGKHYPVGPDDHLIYVATVSQEDGEGSGWNGGVGYYLYENFIRKMKSPKGISIISNGKSTNSFVGDRKITLHLNYTDADYWGMHSYSFIEGKAFNEEHIKEKDRVAVITRATRDSYFGEGVSALGKSIETDNIEYKVLGVVENVSEAAIYQYSDIYVPLGLAAHHLQNPDLIGQFTVIFQGESSSDIPTIKEEYKDLVARLEVPAASKGWKQDYDIISSFAMSKIERISSAFVIGQKPQMGLLTLFLSLAMLMFMLLPALNLINLNSSRISERSSEIGVRKAFGANSMTLAWQFIVENIIVTLIGGGLGLLLALGVLEIIENSELITHIELGLQFNVFLLAIFLCLVFGLLSGVLPAYRMSKIQVVNALKGLNS
ncbi:MAG: ABC transporter permease [Bacteroidia bacterium]|nr:ABC transporter permease [Bacteroidia bacterium]